MIGRPDIAGKQWLKTSAVFFVFIIGFFLQWMGWLDLAPLHRFLEAHSHFWWAPALLLACMVFMYAFAFPASLLILLAGLLYPPLYATLLTVAGGIMGGLAAYHLVHHLSADTVQRVSETSLVKHLKKNAGLIELCALRILPGLPHSMINYGAGLLEIRPVIFVISTLIGLSIKGFVYTSAVHRAMHIKPGENALTLHTLWPLIALAALLALGGWIKGLSSRNARVLR